MKLYRCIGWLVLIFALGMAPAACRPRPVESLAPAPVQLPTEPAQPDPLERGPDSGDLGPSAPSINLPEAGSPAQKAAAPDGPAAAGAAGAEKRIVSPRDGASPVPPKQLAARTEPKALHRAARRSRPVGKPRLVVLANRKFVGSVDQWRSDARILISESYDETTREGAKVKSTEGGRTKAISIQDRVDGGRRSPLSEDAFWSAEEAFVNGLRRAGYPVVDRDAAVRLTSDASASGREPRPERDALNVETKALRQHADWVVEWLITPATAGEDDFVMSAKAVDLDSGRILAFVSSQSLPRPLHFPGAPQRRRAKPPDRIAEELASAIADQLPR